MNDWQEAQLLVTKINQLENRTCVEPSFRAGMIQLSSHKKQNTTFLQQTIEQPKFQLFRQDDHSNGLHTRSSTSSQKKRKTPHALKYKFQIMNADDETEYRKGMEKLRRQSTALLPTNLKYIPKNPHQLSLVPRHLKASTSEPTQVFSRSRPMASRQSEAQLKDLDLFHLGKQLLDKNPLPETPDSPTMLNFYRAKPLRESSKQSGRIIVGSANITIGMRFMPQPNQPILPDAKFGDKIRSKNKMSHKKINLYKSQHSSYFLAKVLKDLKINQNQQLDENPTERESF